MTARIKNNSAPVWLCAFAAFTVAAVFPTFAQKNNQGAPEKASSKESKELVRLYNPEGMTQPKAYSHVGEVLGGKLVFLSGQVSQDAAGNVVGKGDIRAQTRQILANLETALKAVGGDWSNVVKMNTYITDDANIQAFREVREEVLANVQPRPASTAVVVSKLFGEDWLLEIELVAAVPNKPSKNKKK